MRKLGILSVVVLCLAGSAAQAAVIFQALGPLAPPSSVGPVAVSPFSQVPQTAIVNGTSVSAVPGSPIGGTLGLAPNATKQTIGGGWATWSHGYTGAVYVYGGTTSTLTLPAGATAFYLYVESQTFANHVFTATTNRGAPSGPFTVSGQGGAAGVGFFATNGDTIATITVTTDDVTGFAIGEFGASNAIVNGSFGDIPALSTWGFLALGLALALAGMLFLRSRAA